MAYPIKTNLWFSHIIHYNRRPLQDPPPSILHPLITSHQFSTTPLAKWMLRFGYSNRKSANHLFVACWCWMNFGAQQLAEQVWIGTPLLASSHRDNDGERTQLREENVANKPSFSTIPTHYFWLAQLRRFPKDFTKLQEFFWVLVG